MVASPARPSTSTGRPSAVGVRLREWRRRRQLSQLDLANRAGVSARHVSFIETGRATPTSAMIARLSEQLDVPLRDRNAILLAAGFAPAYPEHGMDEPSMAHVSEAVNRVLDAQLPFPAAVIDRHWELVASNDAIEVFLAGVRPVLLEPPVNVLRLSLHPDGMAPRIINLAEWRAHLLGRLRRQVDDTGDPELATLLAELLDYPAPPESGSDPARIVVPLQFRSADTVLNLFSTTTIFGTPLDVTVSELAIESFFPADDRTRMALSTR